MREDSRVRRGVLDDAQFVISIEGLQTRRFVDKLRTCVQLNHPVSISEKLPRITVNAFERSVWCWDLSVNLDNWSQRSVRYRYCSSRVHREVNHGWMKVKIVRYLRRSESRKSRPFHVLNLTLIPCLARGCSTERVDYCNVSSTCHHSTGLLCSRPVHASF